ncbi:Mce protein [Mycolicibacterium frederiksbergense]|uniref:Mce protein n=1 Tax=Mycolicibacterium frederiksbergense TaxID=117567 RepID=UPI00265C0275|nr:Mce protein [Mycolicibacterium frederiksbergense]MBX9922180.1 tetratricopeptide repeat protein [Mycolicibacterium frederiksbergense]MDO0975298.1 Mce protein [Mycolicibacterium frederiksbergense]
MADDAATPSGEVSESASEAEATATEETLETPEDEAVEDFDDAVAEESAEPGMSHLKLATIVGLVVVLALAGLVGWLGFRTYESQKLEAQRALFLQVGRQGAINLTTIDWEHAEADVQRIVDSATGTFYDNFQQRAGPFIEVVKQAQSKSVGTVTEAGLESESDTEASVLVAVTVQTSNAGAAEQQPRLWRMRVTVQDVGDDQVKVSNVEFVP